MPVTDIGGRMPWGEAFRLTKILAADPSSQVAASIGEWRHPWSREALILADHYDLAHKIAAGKRKPKSYPRPWDQREKRYGGGQGFSKAHLRHVLTQHRALAGDEESQVV